MSSVETDLRLKFAGSLVEQLGAQLYPSATATVAELISNAWDADAENVWVTIPFGESWMPDSEIVVIDDGTGMSHDAARDAYLVVGRRRRLETGSDQTESGRQLHGRKGIGKLAAFGTARILECATLRDGELTSFRLDYDAIRKLKPDEDYVVEDAQDDSPPVNPETGKPLAHGTRIRLTELWLKRALSEDQFMRSMSRRFAIAQSEMQVVINGRSLERFDIPVQFKFPRDAVPDDGVSVADDGWGEEDIGDGERVRWWLGFTEKPLDEDALRGVSILARGKMAQRPFMFARAQGVEGQLGQEYLVGEVEADWLDSGTGVEDDLIQSNRDQLQLEDPRVDRLMEWGRKRLNWALRTRQRMRADQAMAGFTVSEEVKQLLEPFTPQERTAFERIAKIASELPEATASSVTELMRSVVDAQADRVVRELMEEIAQEDDVFQERMWSLVQKFGLIDARRNLTIIEARLGTIRKLKEAIETGAREVPEIHQIIKADTWLLDPRWYLLDDEVDPNAIGAGYAPELDEKGQQIDFLFVLQPRSPAPIDQVVVVEIKRGTHPDGSERRATDDEVDKFAGYVLAIREHYASNTDRPTVRGLMIAQGYTAKAKLKREGYEQITDPKMEFKTWARVIDETERMHVGWLAVSERRIARDKDGA
jgi:hypothetical protein